MNTNLVILTLYACLSGTAAYGAENDDCGPAPQDLQDPAKLKAAIDHLAKPQVLMDKAKIEAAVQIDEPLSHGLDLDPALIGFLMHSPDVKVTGAEEGGGRWPKSNPRSRMLWIAHGLQGGAGSAAFQGYLKLYKLVDDPKDFAELNDSTPDFKKIDKAAISEARYWCDSGLDAIMEALNLARARKQKTLIELRAAKAKEAAEAQAQQARQPRGPSPVSSASGKPAESESPAPKPSGGTTSLFEAARRATEAMEKVQTPPPPK